MTFTILPRLGQTALVVIQEPLRGMQINMGSML